MFRRQANSSYPPDISCRAVVIWIDWYAYHLARFEGLQEAFGSEGQVVGLELVGGMGVHAGLTFREERAAHLPVFTIAPNSSWREISKLRMSFQVWQRLNELNPEVVLVPGYYTLPAVAAAVWARLHQRDSVLMTESTEGDHRRTSWKEALKSVSIRTLFNWAVVGGAPHLRYLIKLGFSTERIRRFYDVVGNERIAEATTELRDEVSGKDFDLPAKYFLFVGRLAPEKNVSGLLEAWLKYRDSGGSWSLVLAGAGAEADILHAIVAGTVWGKEVIFAGHRTYEQLIPYFSFASCFVLPSTREPWGLVVNEAMAASLPVIVSSRCGCAEDLVVSESNGLIFDVSHPGELKACLHSMEQCSSAELKAMGASSYERVQPYSPRNFGREIAGIFTAEKQLRVNAGVSKEKSV